MSSLTQTQVFNRTDTVIESWYWAMKSKELKKGQVKPLKFLGRDLAIYRGEDGVVRAVDAYCPHMGAHFAEGKVDGKGIRCFFHGWKFDEAGQLVDIPCRKAPGIHEQIKTHPVTEKYGTIWIYTGETPTHPVHFVPELEHVELDTSFGNTFEKGCHPNVVMVNAIDAHHFNTVHNLPVKLKFEIKPLGANMVQFNNLTHMPKSHWLLRFFSRFYKDALTYSMCYTSGSTGSVTVGPDFLHCHIIFALRPTPEGKAEGLTILLTPKRFGAFGRLVINPVVLFATKLVGNYFAKGDTEVFKSIRFSISRPIKEDESIIRFIQHLEKQKTSLWGFGTHLNPKATTEKANEAEELAEADALTADNRPRERHLRVLQHGEAS